MQHAIIEERLLGSSDVYSISLGSGLLSKFKLRPARRLLGSFAVTAMVVAMSACGGGGTGGGTLSAPIPAITPTVSVTNNIVTTAPVANYALNSEEAAAYALINSERLRCGFGVMAQNTKLDVAARNHADWNQINNNIGHYEAAGTPGFTGVYHYDRMVAAGYAASAGLFSGNDEYTTTEGTNNKVGYGEKSVRILLNAPYHMRSLLAGYREVGVSIRNSIETGSIHGPRVDTQIQTGYKITDGEQKIGIAEMLTYPCQGTTGVAPSLNHESPNPVPSRNLSVNPLGSSIYIMTRPGNSLIITNSSLVVTGTGAVVTLRAPVNAANDPYPGSFSNNDTYIAADAPMAANTQHTFTYSGSNNGVVFTNRNFTFTTGT